MVRWTGAGQALRPAAGPSRRFGAEHEQWGSRVRRALIAGAIRMFTVTSAFGCAVRGRVATGESPDRPAANYAIRAVQPAARSGPGGMHLLERQPARTRDRESPRAATAIPRKRSAFGMRVQSQRCTNSFAASAGVSAPERSSSLAEAERSLRIAGVEAVRVVVGHDGNHRRSRATYETPSMIHPARSLGSSRRWGLEFLPHCSHGRAGAGSAPNRASAS